MSKSYQPSERKPVHPIRRMQHAIRRASAYESRPDAFVDRVAARHVKPLLDALESEHSGNMLSRLRQANHELVCPICKMLAVWRASL